MKIYFAWSGNRSWEIATALGKLINKVIQAAEPWISSDIDKGTRWQEEIGNHLEEAKVGIVCLTPENLTAPWIHFEAGAISKIKGSHPCTFLLHLGTSDVKPPLSQFQHTIAEKSDIKKLLYTINKLIDQAGERALPEKDLDGKHGAFWPSFEDKLREIGKGTVAPPRREQQDVLDEILTIVESLASVSARPMETTSFVRRLGMPTDAKIKCPKCGAVFTADEGCREIGYRLEALPIPIVGRDTKIKCPKCGAIFTVDEGLAEIQKRGF